MFVIWGYGQRGKEIVRRLGYNRVFAIIDKSIPNNCKEIDGLRVIRFVDYLNKFAMYPIIITPKNYGQEIKDMLAENGVVNTLSFDEDYHDMVSFLMWNKKDSLLRDAGANTLLIGYSGLSLLIKEYFEENKCRCDIYSGQSDDGFLVSNLYQKTHQYQQVITTKHINNYQRIVQKYRGKNVDLTMIGRNKLLWKNSKIEKYCNKHKGKRLFIVATGPSLRTDDLDLLYSKNELCVGVNGIVHAFDKTAWRPNYYVLSDSQAVRNYSESLNSSEYECFVSDNCECYLYTESENINIYHLDNYCRDKDLYDFSNDFSESAVAGCTVTYVAIQLAVYMGAEEIYLLGVDCNYLKDNRLNYFSNKIVESAGIDHKTDEMQIAYASAKQYADSHNIKIYNATRGGMLEVFERVDFDSIFEK